MHKDIFINWHEQVDIVKDYKNFFKWRKELKLYIIKFEKNNILRPKIYPANCTVWGDWQWLVIIITHNNCIFSANNRIQGTWTWKKNRF